MGNPIKYSTSVTSGSYQKGNVAVGVNPISYGPTSTTGWYNSPTPTGGNFIVTEVVDGNTPPRFYAPTTDAEWIRLAQQEGATGANTGSVSSVKSWFASQANYVITNIDFPTSLPSIVGNGLVLNLEAGINASYPGTGTTWTDISGLGNNGSLINGPTFNSGQGAIVFDGVDDYVNSTMTVNTLGLTTDNGATMMILLNITLLSRWTGVINFTGFGGNDVDFGWDLDPGNVVRIWKNNNAASILDITTNSGKWVWYTLTSNSSGMKFFVNSNLQSNNTTLTGNITNSVSGRYLRIMDHWDSPVSGKLANVLIYNKELTQAEILQNYHQGNIVTDGLVMAVDAGNLVSYESGSNTTYSLTGSFSGSLTNGTSFDGSNGGSWVFDGVDDFINLPINSAFNTPSVTFEVWANLQSINDRHIIYVNWQGNSLEVYYDRSVVMYNYSSGGQLGAGTSAAVFNWDTWTHFVGTYDDASQTLKTYVNGVLLGTRTSTPSTIYSVNVHKISGTDFGGEVKGKISIVRHYNRALSLSEIQQNYNAQRSRYGV